MNRWVFWSCYICCCVVHCMAIDLYSLNGFKISQQLLYWFLCVYFVCYSLLTRRLIGCMWTCQKEDRCMCQDNDINLSICSDHTMNSYLYLSIFVEMAFQLVLLIQWAWVLDDWYCIFFKNKLCILFCVAMIILKMV